MNIGRILPTEAAAILNVSPQFVRVAMQQGKLPIGTAVQMSSIWTYHISEKLLADYGLLLYEHLTPQEMTEQYFSAYNAANPSHRMTAMENMNYCLAVKR